MCSSCCLQNGRCCTFEWQSKADGTSLGSPRSTEATRETVKQPSTSCVSQRPLTTVAGGAEAGAIVGYDDGCDGRCRRRRVTRISVCGRHTRKHGDRPRAPFLLITADVWPLDCSISRSLPTFCLPFRAAMRVTRRQVSHDGRQSSASGCQSEQGRHLMPTAAAAAWRSAVNVMASLSDRAIQALPAILCLTKLLKLWHAFDLISGACHMSMSTGIEN